MSITMPETMQTNANGLDSEIFTSCTRAISIVILADCYCFSFFPHAPLLLFLIFQLMHRKPRIEAEKET
ncbi:hypothetical protein KZ483_05390 [Paenibacillus sp. sptzw28]|uniref:hypothetical protein n=1 Tax=Paenibacillus sp. sptzw28 TaxID=715179 RepID=UPI001C6F48DC|nr:hypothetical protein [Paenibacillus sp. sptzw28]QYR22415.1 hypothetical protein KZ483_05390 [Paenibacillus sp. sptzw28]